MNQRRSASTRWAGNTLLDCENFARPLKVGRIDADVEEQESAIQTSQDLLAKECARRIGTPLAGRPRIRPKRFESMGAEDTASGVLTRDD